MVLAQECQLLDAIELALEARGRPLRVLLGETFRLVGQIEFSLSAPRARRLRIRESPSVLTG